jgi:pyruvate/2-oxoglutarate/acetoin dehydrogenase E1 component
MERHENSVIMGQDIAEYGGAFKITDGFCSAIGKERVINTPICARWFRQEWVYLLMVTKQSLKCIC